MEEREVRWQSKEFEYRSKTNGWYWKSIVIAVLILSFAVWQRNFLFGFFVLVAEILILVWGSQEPRTIEVVLGEKGIAINSNTPYAYNDLESFSIESVGGEWDVLGLKFKRRFRPEVTILLPRGKTTEARNMLGSLVLETEPDPPSLLDSIQKFLGF